MSRFKKMLKPGVDQLERRAVMAAGGPSDQAQYMLELINEARTNPAAAAQRAASQDTTDLTMTMDYYGESISNAVAQVSQTPAKQPLAWNDSLAAAAQMQSQFQADSGQQTHSGPNGMNLDQRMASKGYTGQTNASENAYAYAKSVDNAMQAFLMDWGVADKGHRRNLLQGNVGKDQSFNEVGIGIVATSNKDLGPLVVTQNFARSSARPNPKLVGVIYNDSDRNDFYTPGEGVDQVLIRAQNLDTGEVSTTTNWDSGGFQMDLQPGRYTVSARRGVRSLGVQNVTVGSENVKLDFVANPDASPVITTPVATTPTPTRQAPVNVITNNGNTPVRRAMNRVAGKVETITVPNAKLDVLVNSTRFDNSSISNWSSFKPKG